MLFQSTCGKSVSRLTGNPLCCQRQLHHYITPKSINNQELNNRSPKKGEERNDMKQIEKWLQDNNITYRLAKWGNPVYQWWILCIWFTGNIWFLSWSKRTHKNCHIWAVHAPKTHLCIQHTGNTPPYKLRDGTQTGGVFPEGKNQKWEEEPTMSNRSRSPPTHQNSPPTVFSPSAVSRYGDFCTFATAYLAA